MNSTRGTPAAGKQSSPPKTRGKAVQARAASASAVWIGPSSVTGVVPR